MTNRDHTHWPLDEEITAVGGSYRLVKESRLDVNGREVLYVVGHGVYDGTCCGAGGCAYALVPGFVVRWRDRTSQSGLPVSLVEPIRDDATQSQIEVQIRQRETVQQVEFL